MPNRSPSSSTQPRAHAVAAGAELVDLVDVAVVLVGDLADELFDQVFERHEARDSAVLVDDHREVVRLALHLLQQGVGLHRLGHEDGGLREFAGRRAVPSASSRPCS